MDFIKIKNFSLSQGIIKKMRGQATDWENLFPNDVSGQGLESTVYKGLLQLNTKIIPLKVRTRHKQLFHQRRLQSTNMKCVQHH